MSPTRAFSLLLAATALASTLTGCGSGGGANTLTLYSAQHEQTTAAIVAAFTRATGIKVRVDSNDEDVLTAQLEREGGRSPADLFLTENSNWLQQLDDAKLLAPVRAATLRQVPAADSATDQRWVGVSARVSALVYDPAKVSATQLPRSVLGLADPRWKGRLEVAPAETDFWPIVSSVDKAKGDAATLAWLRGVKANAGSGAQVPDNETLTSDVNRGTASLGLINHYYYYRIRAEQGAAKMHAKLAFFGAGDPGYVEDISAAGILASSHHLAAAQRFLAFLTGAGQRVIAQSDSFEYPLNLHVAANPALPPLSSLHPCGFTPAELGTGLDAKRLLQQVGLI